MGWKRTTNLAGGLHDILKTRFAAVRRAQPWLHWMAMRAAVVGRQWREQGWKALRLEVCPGCDKPGLGSTAALQGAHAKICAGVH